ncbi:SDR family oxidoreductase [Williamsia maris]|uniref:NADP-dependent 3-hydroxy acid dehydrogenase YdfG n=1 Tax=Williamsia maris TaxID=72806 RepID=A0ABT1HJ95_9NOCA|nr:SDR family oxidoreductase [Williamsia maris]MCP2178002.1 NADP-dependent 3-hydroxy acid dehydrogenase YdfG [Williamsia maris]
MTTSEKIILVSGASSGIGAAVASRLARDGHHVVLAARRADRLTALVTDLAATGGSAEARDLDVTDRDTFARLLDEIVAAHGRIDVIINNAGVMPLSRLDALLVDEWDAMIDVNIKGLLHGIAAALPHFLRQDGGHFITTASVGAHEVVPTSAVYFGTKFAAWAITEGLRRELDPSIRVTTVSPGVVDSELADHITDPVAREAMQSYRSSALPAEAIASTVAWVIDQPADVDVNEIIRPAGQRA